MICVSLPDQSRWTREFFLFSFSVSFVKEIEREDWLDIIVNLWFAAGYQLNNRNRATLPFKFLFPLNICPRRLYMRMPPFQRQQHFYSDVPFLQVWGGRGVVKLWTPYRDRHESLRHGYLFINTDIKRQIYKYKRTMKYCCFIINNIFCYLSHFRSYGRHSRTLSYFFPATL